MRLGFVADPPTRQHCVAAIPALRPVQLAPEFGERKIPPSLPAESVDGAPGRNAKAGWSAWMYGRGVPVYQFVSQVQLVPPEVDLQRLMPPTYTVEGLSGATCRTRS